MKYSVGLQPPFAFSAYWYAVGAALIVLAFAVITLVPRHIGDFTITFRSPFRLGKLRRKSLEQIDGIERAYKTGELDSRGVCQKVIGELRGYVHEATGWQTQSMVSDELLKLPSPALGTFVKQYYESEFAYHSKGNPDDAVKMGKEVVETTHAYAKEINRAIWGYWFRLRFSRVLYWILQRIPFVLSRAITERLRKNSLIRIGRLEFILQRGNPDLYILYTQVRLEVRCFYQAVLGCESDEMIPVSLQRNNKIYLASVAKDFLSQEFSSGSRNDLQKTINSSKELITKWE